MWNGKIKALTFSFDDGVTQDKKLVEILNKYNLKATFNLNSAFFGLKNELVYGNNRINHNKILLSEVRDVYKNHEIAVHTLTHQLLPKLEEETIIRQVEEDRLKLSEIFGYEVVGMAYPCGGENNNDRVANIIKNHTGVKYSRTIVSTYNFDLQKNYYRFNPSIYYIETEKLFQMGKEFISLKCDKPQLFYIWGHSYEMDFTETTWQKFEEFCELISNQKDIFYGTNKETILGD